MIAAEVSIQVYADSLEDAVAKSKELKVSDFISFEGEHCDSEMRVHGVYGDYKALNP